MSKIVLNSSLIIGKCLPCLRKDVSKFQIKTMELDENLLMYFPKVEYIYAHDPTKRSKTGDVVLLRKLSERLSRQIAHTVEKIIFPLGDITDPITGKSVVVSEYRESLDDRIKKFGPLKSTFKYEDAPPRGWQEDKKDFSHRESYVKYHDSDEDQPYAV